ncbi:hypothetical protein O3P69_002360 [Scylla paramamosain]|uniref:Uncharacterized protein n=1 Tax=Scylla paramamosain TaxID=85552 RepID=A0AAW0V8E2_SCYPA
MQRTANTPKAHSMYSIIAYHESRSGEGVAPCPARWSYPPRWTHGGSGQETAGNRTMAEHVYTHCLINTLNLPC